MKGASKNFQKRDLPLVETVKKRFQNPDLKEKELDNLIKFCYFSLEMTISQIHDLMEINERVKKKE